MPKYHGMTILTKELRRVIANSGYKTGMLCALTVLNDVFDFTDDELVEFFNDCDKLLESMNDNEDDWKKINYQLERRLGIKVI